MRCRVFSLAEAAPDCVHLVAPGSQGPMLAATAADVSCVPHAGRVPGAVHLTGHAEAMSGPVDEQLRAHLGLDDDGLVARLVPDTVRLEWTVERGIKAKPPVDVDAGDYALADIEALAGRQDAWIAHLDAHHREDLRDLVADEVQPVAVVRPVHADEHGIVLREHVGVHRRDVRSPSPSGPGAVSVRRPRPRCRSCRR